MNFDPSTARPVEPDTPFDPTTAVPEGTPPVRTVLKAAATIKPDDMAEAERLAKRYPAPVDTLYRNLTDVRLQAAVDDADERLKTSPKLAAALAQNPRLAAMAHDDIEPLSRLEAFTNALQRGLTRTMQGSDADNVVNSARLLDIIDRIEKGELKTDADIARATPYASIFAGVGRSPESLARLRAIASRNLSENTAEYLTREKEVKGLPASRDYEEFQKSATFGEALSRIGGAPVRITSEVVAESLGALAPAIPIIAGAGLAGGPAALAGAVGLTSAGTEYVNALPAIFQKLGVDMNDLEAVRAAVRTPEFQEEARKAIVKAGVIGAFDAATAGVAGVTLAKTPIRNLAAQTAVQATGGGAGEAAGSTAIGEEISPAAVLSEMLGEVPGAVLDVAVLEGRKVLAEAGRQKQAVDDSEQLAEALKTAGASALRTVRSPEQFRALMQTMTDGKVYIDGEVLNQLPPDVIAALPESVQQDIPNAAAISAAVEIPVADILAIAPGTPLEQIVVDNARTEPGAMTKLEAETAGQRAGEYLQQEAERVIAQAQDQEAMRASQETVKQNIKAQLAATGRFRDAVNEGYATWASAFYTAYGSRMGMTPEQFFQRYPLRILGAPSNAGQTVMEQVPAVFDISLVEDGNKLRDYKVDGASISLDVRPDGVKISSVRVPAAKRGQGAARSAMQKLVEQADREGVTLSLDASPPDKKTRLDKLVQFYQSLGFELTGRTINAAGDPEMIRQPAAGPGGAGSLEQSAYHGTPHRVDRFSLHKIGTGEGAQAFGWGLYFAGKREVAEHYRKTLSDGTGDTGAVIVNGTKIDAFSPEGHAARLLFYNDQREMRSLAKQMLKEALAGEPYTVETAQKQGMSASDYYGRLNAFISSHTRRNINVVKGNLYKVELPEDGELLDYDKSIGSQPAAVKAKLKASGILKDWKESRSDYSLPQDVRPDRGGALYALLSHKFGGDQAASQFLHSIGIQGMRYKAGQINGARGGGHNYVIWDEAAISEPESLYQSAPTPRGTFNPASLELVLNPNANLSTFFHETGHFFLEVMADIASQPDAPAQIVEDMNTFLKWAGIKGDENVGGQDAGGVLGQADAEADAEAQADAVYSEIANDQEMIDALEVYMVSGDPPEGALNDRLLEYINRLPPVPADSYLTFYRNQPRGARPWRRGWSSWTINEDQTRFFGGRDFEVLKRKGVHGLDLNRLGEYRTRVTGEYSQYGSQGEWLVLNESVFNQDGQPTAAQPTQPRRTPLETWNAMTLDQKRPYHERWAESIEQYVMEGKAPSVELQPLMRRFATWLKSVYGSIKAFLASRGVAPAAGGETLGQAPAPEGVLTDENGKPLVLYHGTAQELVGGKFDPNRAQSEGGAFYFSHSPLFKNKANNANTYARQRAGDSPNVIPVYLKMKNPLVVGFTEPMPAGDTEVEAWLNRMQKFNRGLDKNKERYYKNAIREAVRGGHDGVIVRNVEDVPNDMAMRWVDETDVYIVFDPKQIVSAISGEVLGQDPSAQPGPPMALNDDIRRVMDRMLATDEQIKQANEVAGLMPDEAADGEANERLRKRSIADLKWAVKARDAAIAKLRKQAASIEKGIREQVTAEVNQRPEVLAKAKLDELRRAARDGGPAPNVLREQRRGEGMVVYEILDGGAVVGSVVVLNKTTIVGDEVVSVTQIHNIGIDDPNAKGKGLGVAAYEQIIRQALEGGGQVWSDPSVSVEAQRVYDALRRRGYKVEKNKGKPPTKEADGALVSDGSYVFRVVSAPAPAKTRQPSYAELATIADSFGYESPDAMLKAIDAFGNKKDVIDGMTEQRMLEEHGDLIDERAIQQAANEAVHNEARARSLATELRTQAEMLGARTDTGETNAKGSRVTVNALVEAAKQFAANVVGRTPLRDLRSKAWQHTAAERRAAKRWQESTAAGKTQDAVKAKQDQMLNHAAAKAALDAQGEAQKILDFFRRVTKGNDEKVVERGRDPDIVNAARAVLKAYGVETATTKTAEDYLEVVQRQDPELAAALQDTVREATRNAQPLDALTFQELQGLHEQVESLWHRAKTSRQMEVDGDVLDLDEAQDAVYARLEEIGIPDRIPGEGRGVTKVERRVRKLREMRLSLTRVEAWAEAMDGKAGGPIWRNIFLPIKAAADRVRQRRVGVFKQLEEATRNVAPAIRVGKIEAPEIGYVFGEEATHNDVGMAELLPALLNVGNESNKAKLLLGRKWATENPDGTLDTSRWDAFIKRLHDQGVLTKEHWDYVQTWWDVLESLKDGAQKAHRHVHGRFFNEITATPVETPFGTYRGGYYPAQTDTELVTDMAIKKLAEAENENMSYSFPSVGHGFTKERAKAYNRPLKLDMNVGFQHIDKVILFSEMAPAAQGVGRLLKRPKVSQPLERIMPGVYESLLVPWSNDASRQIVERPVMGDGVFNKGASIIRARVGLQLMMGNLINAAQQVSGVPAAAAKMDADGLKRGHLRKALAQWVAHPIAFSERVWEKSTYMRDRAENEVAQLNDTMRDILFNPTLLQRGDAFARRHGYFLQTWMDNRLSPIVWQAGYDAWLRAQPKMDAIGMTPEQLDEALKKQDREAVLYADGLVRQTQGSNLPEDVSRFERGIGFIRLFTQFAGYFNMQANTNAASIVKLADQGGLKKNMGRGFYVMMLGLLAPIWIAEVIGLALRGGAEDDDEDGEVWDDWLRSVFGLGTFRGLVAMVPAFGPFATSVVNRFATDTPTDDKMSVSPAFSALEALGGSIYGGYQLTTGADVNEQRLLRDLALAAGTATGLPLFMVARPAGYLTGIADDRIEPTGPGDMARGLITGTASPESKIQR